MKENIKELFKYKEVNKLKSVYRSSSVDKRKESSAEHSWGTLILANYYLNKLNLKLDRTKVYELLMYHDLVEIHAGDSPLHPKGKERDKNKKFDDEKKAADKLRAELPKEMSNKFYALFIEFEEAKTPEAKFAKAMDAFEAQIQEIDHKEDWKGWTKDFLLKSKTDHFEDFPEIKKDLLDLIDHLDEEGYFSQ